MKKKKPQRTGNRYKQFQIKGVPFGQNNILKKNKKKNHTTKSNFRAFAFARFPKCVSF